MKSTHSQRLERWLGNERISQLSDSMRGWYGPPIHLLDCPGSVRVCGDGDFIGPFDRGYFMSAADSFREFWRRSGHVRHGTLNAGFASVSDALSRASQGFVAYPSGFVSKTGTTGVAGRSNTLWQVGATPAIGTIPSAAPGGNAPTSATTGAMIYNNPASGTAHLVGANMSASVLGNNLLLYDRIFHVAKTMNSTATEAVTGVPTRYQSTTPSDPNYAGGNFLSIEVGLTALAATAHNWTVNLYTNQAGTGGQTMPSITGASGGLVNTLDHTGAPFFAPLASGDTGIQALTQMQCSATVATGLVNFMIGHPIGFMSFPSASTTFPFDWLTNQSQAPRVFDDACLALLEISKPATTATAYHGQIALTFAAP